MTRPTIEQIEQAEKLLSGVSPSVAATMLARAMAEKAQWQPIETAPRDGTNIVVHAPRRGNGTKRRSRNGCVMNVAHFEEGWGWLSTPGDYQAQATHWMPLPPPPSEQVQP